MRPSVRGGTEAVAEEDHEIRLRSSEKARVKGQAEVRPARDLIGINVVQTGTLTFDDVTDDAPAPLFVIDLWGTLEPDT